MQLFCSTAKVSLSNFIPILYPERFMLCKEVVYNGLRLEVYIPFFIYIRTQSAPLSFFNSNVSSVG